VTTFPPMARAISPRSRTPMVTVMVTRCVASQELESSTARITSSVAPPSRPRREARSTASPTSTATQPTKMAEAGACTRRSASGRRRTTPSTTASSSARGSSRWWAVSITSSARRRSRWRAPLAHATTGPRQGGELQGGEGAPERRCEPADHHGTILPPRLDAEPAGGPYPARTHRRRAGNRRVYPWRRRIRGDRGSPRTGGRGRWPLRSRYRPGGGEAAPRSGLNLSSLACAGCRPIRPA
jgi:hypothetical protein